ncbi:MAG: chloride channel protein, partial [Mycobacterium leprae]
MSRISFRRVLPLSALLGVGVGLFGTLFYLVWHLLQDWLWEGLPNPLDRIWVSGALGLVIGLVIMRLGDPGTMADIIHHFHHKGKLPAADNVPIIPISLIGLVGGSSAGPEGVLTQVCGSMGSWVAERFGARELTRILTQAGMGAGFGAFLGAPVGGALLWLEMPHKKG